MDCVSIASFVVLINGYVLKPFSFSRGLRHGYPMSCFLFLLVTKGLSRIMGEAREKEELQGVKISPSEVISHLLFVDDVFLFGAGICQEFVSLKNIMHIYCSATGVDVNMTKYGLLLHFT
jgi:hypothetical protein